LYHLPYSPDLALSDFHFCHKFASDGDVKTAVMRWSKLQGTDFYEAGINKLVPRLDKCLNLVGGYVEK
jgi:hypothetical protein